MAPIETVVVEGGQASHSPIMDDLKVPVGHGEHGWEVNDWLLSPNPQLAEHRNQIEKATSEGLPSSWSKSEDETCFCGLTPNRRYMVLFTTAELPKAQGVL